MQYKRWRAHHGEHTTIIDSEEIPEEYNEDDSDVESEFEERNMELEEWLAEWMEKKELGHVDYLAMKRISYFDNYLWMTGHNL